jgi:hypothetical protein
LDELQKLAADIITKMTGNPHFATPNPTLVAVQAALDASLATTAAYIAVRQTIEQRLTERDDATEVLRNILEDLAAYVQVASGGDAAIILSAGMSVRATPTPIGPLPAPLNVDAVEGETEGAINLQWDYVHGAHFYEVEHTPTPNDLSSWTNHTNVSRTRASLSGLPSGTRMYFRVRALGAAGAGPWSDHAVKMVP